MPDVPPVKRITFLFTCILSVYLVKMMLNVRSKNKIAERIIIIVYKNVSGAIFHFTFLLLLGVRTTYGILPPTLLFYKSRCLFVIRYCIASITACFGGFGLKPNSVLALLM